MSRTLSGPSIAAINAQETGEAFLVLLTISHPDLAESICVNNGGADIVSNTTTFIAFPFDISLPDDADNVPTRAQLSMDNIDRRIVTAVRTLTSAPTVLIQLVRAADPDTVEIEWPDFKLTNVTYDAKVVQGDLTIEEFTTEPFPAATFSQAFFPGLF